MKSILKITKHKIFVIMAFIFVLSLSMNFCQAYNITFYAERTMDDFFQEPVCYWVSSVVAAQSTVDWYNSVKYNSDVVNGWVYNNGNYDSFFDRQPRWDTFKTRSLIFHDSVNTNYTPGNNYTYQTYTARFNADNVIYENVNNSGRTNISGGSANYYHSQAFYQAKMKIKNGDTFVGIDVITKDSENAIINRLNQTNTTTTRFSNGNYTKNSNGTYTGDLLTTAAFFSLAKMNPTDWAGSSVSGYSGWNKNYPVPDKSVLNEYDNILIVPPPKYRKVYVRHINIETGERLPRSATGSGRTITLTDGSVVPNSGGGNNFATFDEYYEFWTGRGISSLKRASMTKVGDDTVDYLGYKRSGANLTYTGPMSIATNVSQLHSTSDTYSLASSENEDYTFVDFYYKLTPPYPSALPVTLVGKQLFDATISQYASATSSETLDYIPSSEQLVPYVKDAYPYVLRGVNYQEAKNTGSVSMGVTVSKNWYGTYYYWKRVAPFSETSCSDTGCVTTPVYNYEQAEANTSGSSSKSLSYAVPYEYDYYQLNNFKMYRITKVELYDSDDNKGGILFDKGNTTFTISPSSSYNSRFNSGINYDRSYSTFGSSSYSLGSNSGHCGWDSSCSDLSNETRSDVNAVTYPQAASATGIGVHFWSTNDYVTIETSSYVLNPVRKDSTVYFKDTSSGTLPKVLLSNLGVTGYTSNALNYYTPANRTIKNDFVWQNLTIPKTRTNGIRHLQSKIYYDVISTSNYNRGVDNFVDMIKWNMITPQDLSQISKLYKDNDVNKVDVFTPVVVDQTIKSDAIINQTETSQNSTIIQKNVPFEISPKGGVDSYYNVNTNQYVDSFYISFDFDLQGYTTYNPSGSVASTSGIVVSARTWIKIPKDGKIRTQAAVDVLNTGNVNVIYQKVNNYYIRVVAMNTPLNLQSIVTQIAYPASSASQKATDGSVLINNSYNLRITDESLRRQLNYYDRSDIYADSNHMAEREYTTTNLGRIYDFKITDCSDIDFKNLFRQTDANGVNVSTGKYIYAGLLKWNMNSQGTNEIISRTDSEIGTAPKRILPLGPYKQTAYLNAPKMGYRISFDLKTTGSLPDNNTRWIEITPEYYYLSKTGQVLKDVALYYKNSSGKYIALAGSGYSIYFKPNDGYRYLNNLGVTSYFGNMSQNLEILNIDGTMRLDKRMMSISANTFVQAWYGEFKLPNSTIAVEKNTYDLNNPLKDGYLAVKFNIVCVDNPNNNLATSVRLGYSYNNKVQGTTTEIPNTSQWDYEGFLGFSKAGNNVDAVNYVLLQLEQGSLRITDQAKYTKVKGTVLLYDLDKRAATDFE